MSRFKIIYHVGDEISLKTRAEAGTLVLGDEGFHIESASPLDVPFSSLTGAEMFRLNRLGRMIKIASSGRTIFLTVVRLNVLGYFVIVNYFKTGVLFGRLRSHVKKVTPGAA